MSRLGHPNCVSVIDFGVDGVPYLVMDLVEGRALRVVLADGPLPVRRARGIARQLLAALAHAHAQEIIHRDIKPENILLGEAVGFEDHVRILDFGLAKLLDNSQQLTVGMALGTPSYMAPEQMREGPVDARVDLYGVGLVLYEMLTGQKAFDAPSTAEILLKQRHQPPPPFSQAAPGVAVPAALEALVMRALEKDPGARFASALAMREALEACAEAPVRDADRTVFEALPWGADGAVAAAPPAVSTAAPAAAASEPRRRGETSLVRLGRRVQAVMRAARTRARGARLPSSRNGRIALGFVAGGAAAAIVLLLVAVRAHRPGPALPGEPAPSKAGGPGAAGPLPARAGSAAGTGLADVDALVAAGKTDEALARLRALTRANPGNADYAAAFGRLCFQRHRYSEGLPAFQSAVRRDPGRRGDPVMINLVIDSLANDKFQDRAEDFLRDLGAPAKALVRQAAASHQSPRVKERARALLREWSNKPFLRWR
jgi:serine/threonine-protein kinase